MAARKLDLNIFLVHHLCLSRVDLSIVHRPVFSIRAESLSIDIYAARMRK